MVCTSVYSSSAAFPVVLEVACTRGSPTPGLRSIAAREFQRKGKGRGGAKCSAAAVTHMIDSRWRLVT